jgi:hypothetical protein
MMVLDNGILLIRDKKKKQKNRRKNHRKAGEKHVKSYLGQQHRSDFSALTYIHLRTVLRKMHAS